ncbi:MAG: flagellar hook capping FlgD N-terminal domain-containing protein [Pseudomonadota bacterium]
MTIAESNIASNKNSLADIAKASGAKASVSGLASSTLDDNFNMFLNLLTTQLKNQNPLEPMDADKFTQQLTQYSGIEQQIKSNSLLTDVIGQLGANSMMSVLGFMNMEVTSGGATTELADGSAKWTLTSPSSSILTGHITIRNDKSEVVATQDYTLNPGEQSFTWNGKDKNGIALPDGNYTISVDAKDATGGVVSVSTQIKGLVTGIDFSGTAPILHVGGKDLRIAEIKSVSAPTNH